MDNFKEKKMRANNELKGIYSALLVSFNEDGSVNEKGTRQIVRHNIDKMKVDGLYVGGSTGENFLLSTDEKKKIFEIAKNEAKDEIKLIAQIGFYCNGCRFGRARFAVAADSGAVILIHPAGGFAHGFFQALRHAFADLHGGAVGLFALGVNLIKIGRFVVTGAARQLDNAAGFFNQQLKIGQTVCFNICHGWILLYG